MRTLRLSAAAVSLAAALALPAVAQAAPRTLTCNSSDTYSGTYANVIVPANGWCNLQSATVLGNAIVLDGGTLNLNASGTIDGSVTVGSSGWLYEDTGWVIGGTTIGNAAQDMQFNGTAHSIYDKGGDGLYVSSATVDGDIVANHEQQGGDIYGSIIRGNVVINGTAANPDFNGAWWITGAGPDPGSFQQIDGNMVLTNNQSPIEVTENHVRRSLVCEGNNPAPDAQYNRVDGPSVGQCTG